jgi:hypothetical protein
MGVVTRLKNRQRETLVVLACGIALWMILASAYTSEQVANSGSGVIAIDDSNNSNSSLTNSSLMASPAVSTTAHVSVGPNVANESSTFWGVSLDGTPTTGPTWSDLSVNLSKTPVKTLRFGAAWADETNWSSGRMYLGTSASANVSVNATNNVTDFATLCKQLPTDRCYLTVPAEIDSISTLGYEVHWLEVTTNWHPTCWAIGNEPQSWKHFDQPWATWRSGNNDSTPNGTQYAQVVHAYTDYFRSLNSTACIVGLESDSDLAETGWFVHNVTTVQPNITEVAIHDYPDGHCPPPHSPPLTLTNLTQVQYDYSKEAVQNIPVAYRSKIAVDIHEFNIGLATPGGVCRYDSTSTDSVFTSAVIAQALASGDPQFTFFRFDCFGRDCMINSTHLNDSPVFYDYEDVLSHMDISRIYNVTASSATVGTWVVLGASDSGLSQSLLIVNANQSNSENVNLTTTVPAGWTATAFCQGPSDPSSIFGSSQYTESVTGNATITVGNQTTCVVQMESPCATSGCGVSLLSSAGDSGTGTQTIGPISASGSSLLYLAVQQDYSSGNAPTITDSTLTWNHRSHGATSSRDALWVYTATVPNGGVSGHTFTLLSGDSGQLGYILIDLAGFAGFDSDVSSTPANATYSSGAPTASISTSEVAASLAFISTIGAGSGSVSLAPLAGQDVLNQNLSPSYAVSFVYGVYSAGTRSVGGTLNATESGWVISDAVDLTVTGNASVTEIAAVNNATNGTHTTRSFNAGGSDLLYLAVAQNYSAGAAPTITDSVLTWSLRGHGGSAASQSTWVYTSVVPSGGITGHNFTIKAGNGLRFGYLIVDLKGFSGFDPEEGSTAPATSYSASTTPSVSDTVNSQALFLAFVSTNSRSGSLSLTPNGGEDVLNDAPSAPYAVSLVYSTASAGQLSLGATLSASQSGWIVSDAVDNPNSGNATVDPTTIQRAPSGSLAVPIDAASGDIIYLAIAQDAAAGAPPLLTVSNLTWTVREHEVTTGGSALWVYTARAPYGGTSTPVTVTAADGLGWGAITVALNGFVGVDRDSTVPGGATYGARPVSISVSALHEAAYLAFISTTSATGTISLTPDSGQSVWNSDPSPSYQVALIYMVTSAGSETIGGNFNVVESGWVISDAADT